MKLSCAFLDIAKSKLKQLKLLPSRVLRKEMEQLFSTAPTSRLLDEKSNDGGQPFGESGSACNELNDQTTSNRNTQIPTCQESVRAT